MPNAKINDKHFLLSTHVQKRWKPSFVKNGSSPASFSFIFYLLQFLQQSYVKNCPSSIQCWDLNPRPSKHESPPITTRPGLPPSKNNLSRCSFAKIYPKCGQKTLERVSLGIAFKNIVFALGAFLSIFRCYHFCPILAMKKVEWLVHFCLQPFYLFATRVRFELLLMWVDFRPVWPEGYIIIFQLLCHLKQWQFA